MTNNPIEIFYCWQAVVTALMVYMLTHGFKSIAPYVYTPESEKGKTFFKRVVLVTIPPVFGFIVASLVPIHPEILIAYVNEQNISKFNAMLIYGSWGAACGQFADYLYTKISKFILDFKPPTTNGAGGDDAGAANA